MRFLVENWANNSYLIDLNQWTSDPDQAKAFRSSSEAFGFCSQNRLPNVRLVVKYDFLTREGAA